jgi:hypothetical protein
MARNMDPRVITVKYDGKCAETGKALKKGEQAVYYPHGRTMYALDSKQAGEFRAWKEDLAMGNNY